MRIDLRNYISETRRRTRREIRIIGHLPLLLSAKYFLQSFHEITRHFPFERKVIRCKKKEKRKRRSGAGEDERAQEIFSSGRKIKNRGVEKPKGKDKGRSGSSLSAQSRASSPPRRCCALPSLSPRRIHRQNVVSHRVVTSLNEFAKEFVRNGSQSIVPRFPLNPRSTLRFSSRFLFPPFLPPPASVFDRIFRVASAVFLAAGTCIKRNSSQLPRVLFHFFVNSLSSRITRGGG